ncbi:lipoprotein signal peptidase [Spiroplasma corruscae]|uniref:Lipoprotein signal peptidase n=1 Tax=Spiroplasma corruscae TaxID=216934 RepID=A0A222EP24_9MOLU|nr:signal peptidase II [Spiroplasma corruscae]ASP28023.1 lipoprotein signal peptidase [Spiroplasma corruscae]
MKDKITFVTNYLKKHKYNWKFKVLICMPLISFLLFFDWISKYLIEINMKQGETRTFIKGLINFDYKINPGAAYGMNSGSPILAISIAAVVSFFILIIFIFVREKYWLIGITLMVAGSYGNLLARMWAPEEAVTGIKGGVIDFLHWDFSILGSNGYIFNLADLFVNIAVVMLVIAFVIYVVDGLMRYKYKSNTILYNEYTEYKDSLKELYLIYWAKFYKKDHEYYLKFKDYLAKRKELSNNWKALKREKVNGTKN